MSNIYLLSCNIKICFQRNFRKLNLPLPIMHMYYGCMMRWIHDNEMNASWEPQTLNSSSWEMALNLSSAMYMSVNVHCFALVLNIYMIMRGKKYFHLLLIQKCDFIAYHNTCTPWRKKFALMVDQDLWILPELVVFIFFHTHLISENVLSLSTICKHVWSSESMLIFVDHFKSDFINVSAILAKCSWVLLWLYSYGYKICFTIMDYMYFMSGTWSMWWENQKLISDFIPLWLIKSFCFSIACS